MARPIVGKPKAKTDLTSYLIEEVWDGRLWYNCSNLIDDCSRQMSLEYIRWRQWGSSLPVLRTLDPMLSPMDTSGNLFKVDT